MMTRIITKLLHSLLLSVISITPQSLWSADLMEVYQLATEEDCQLEVSLIGMQRQCEQRNQACAALLPTISASAGLNYSDNSWLNQDDSSHNVTLNLKQGIYHRSVFKRAELAESQK